MIDQMTIKTARLLWRTRGKEWDYQFLCRPKIMERPGCFYAFRQIFGGIKPGTQLQLLRGCLELDEGRRCDFIAASFLDPQRVDWTNRPIQHFFVYLLEENDNRWCSTDWPLQLLRKLTKPYGAVFALSQDAATANRGSTFFDSLREEQLSDSMTLSVSEAVTTVTDLHTVRINSTKKAKEPRPFQAAARLRNLASQYPFLLLLVGLILVLVLLLHLRRT